MLTKSEMTISMVTPKSFSELLLSMAASSIFMEVIITIYGGNKSYRIIILGTFALRLLYLNQSSILRIVSSMLSINSFSTNVLLLYPPENIRKPPVFLFSGGIEAEHWLKMG